MNNNNYQYQNNDDNNQQNQQIATPNKHWTAMDYNAQQISDKKQPLNTMPNKYQTDSH